MTARLIQMLCQNCYCCCRQGTQIIPWIRVNQFLRLVSGKQRIWKRRRRSFWLVMFCKPAFVHPHSSVDLSRLSKLIKIEPGFVFVRPIPQNTVWLIWLTSFLTVPIEADNFSIVEQRVDLFKDTLESGGFCCSVKAACNHPVSKKQQGWFGRALRSKGGGCCL